MSSTPEPREALSPEHALPPVNQPNPGFIVQLFIVPAVIVLAIALVALTINWLANLDNNPREFLNALRRDDQTRWMQAYNLAEHLRRQPEARADADLARDVAAALDEELAAGRLDNESIKVRYYLCSATGMFQSPQVLPVLLKAAATRRDDAEVVVQVWAVRALATFANATPNFHADEHPELVDALLQASYHETRLIRSTAAFGLSVCASEPKQGERARARLRALTSDVAMDVAFNASTQLARLGDPAGLDAILRAFDPAELEVFTLDDSVLGAEDRETAPKEEELEALRKQKRLEILVSALLAAEQLGPKLPPEGRARLTKSLESLSDAELPIDDGHSREKVRVEARRLVDELARTEPPSDS